jgi:hypothetical protein
VTERRSSVTVGATEEAVEGSTRLAAEWVREAPRA